MGVLETSDSLIEELHIQMAREKFLRKCYFFHGKDSSFNPRIIRKNVFSHWTSADLEILVENSVSAIQHIENRKRFTEVLSPGVPTNPLAYSCVFTFHKLYKNGMIGQGGGAVKMLKNNLL